MNWPLGRVVFFAAALAFCGVGFVASLGVDVIVGAVAVAVGSALLVGAIRYAAGGGRRGRRTRR